MAIYVKFEKPRTIKEFLKLFYNTSSYSGNYRYASKTYFDIECEKLHCDKSVRSFDDLLNLVQTYYKSTTPKILMFHLLTLKINYNGKFLKPYFGTCGGMKRIRYIPYSEYNSWGGHYNVKMSESKYTWTELLLLWNIKNQKELEQFINNN